jgi:hypothetical protein
VGEFLLLLLLLGGGVAAGTAGRTVLWPVTSKKTTELPKKTTPAAIPVSAPPPKEGETRGPPPAGPRVGVPLGTRPVGAWRPYQRPGAQVVQQAQAVLRSGARALQAPDPARPGHVVYYQREYDPGSTYVKVTAWQDTRPDGVTA